MSPRVPGYALIAFGATILLASIVASVLLRGPLVDIGAILVLIVGVLLVRGSRRARGWGLVFMGLYLLIGVLLGLTGWMFDSLDARDFEDAARNSPLASRAWGFDMVDLLVSIQSHTAWLYVAAALVGVWSAINLVLLLRARRDPGQVV